MKFKTKKKIDGNREKKLFFILVIFIIFSLIFVSCEKTSDETSSFHEKKGFLHTAERSSKRVLPKKLSDLDKIDDLPRVSTKLENSFTIKNVTISDFLLDKKSKAEIADYIGAWSGNFSLYNADSDFFDELKIYPESLQFDACNIENPTLYVFSPEYSSLCSFGFCEENGNWVSENAIIAIFSSEGNLLALSSDYALSSNFFEIQMENDEFYYILVLKSYQNEDKNNVNLKIRSAVSDRQ